MKLPASAIVLLSITLVVPPAAFAQRAGGRGGSGGGRPGTGGTPTNSQTTSQPTIGPAQPGTPGSAYRPLPGFNPFGPRRIRAARGVPYLWWFGDFASQDTLDVSDRTEVGSPALPQPLPPPESSLIQPMLTLPRPQPTTTAHGNLRLAVTPETAQVYVDGFYVGTVEEISHLEQGLDVAAGWHRLEFRAPGYLTPAVNVTIEADQTLNYRSQLLPIAH